MQRRRFVKCVCGLKTGTSYLREFGQETAIVDYGGTGSGAGLKS